MNHQVALELHKIVPVKVETTLSVAPDLRGLIALTNHDQAEVIDFLKLRPVHTVVMTSFIIDNGIESELNRGKFYAYRNREGSLDGVALIGHTTIVEARSDMALQALAFAARSPETPIHLIMSAGSDAEDFWKAYRTDPTAAPRLRCEEILFETAFPFAVTNCEMDVKTADAADLEQIAEAQAEVAFLECGVDPLVRDPEGFRKRVLRRIEQGRVFTVVENGKLIFKADIISETADAIYLEGIYVAPEYRGQGIGSKCLAKLTLELLNRVEHICLLSNTEFTSAHRSFMKAGYKASDKCITLFV